MQDIVTNKEKKEAKRCQLAAIKHEYCYCVGGLRRDAARLDLRKSREHVFLLLFFLVCFCFCTVMFGFFFYNRLMFTCAV